ncbi:hypothetical protein NQ318_019139 [Aromia moschata]|uniref:Cytochrome P450 n=1 Tax=Aromia moschata TaxID=1265417 RepID=A0AAV8YRA5_9CUCU|nr:hypothetical protein NQ318_019139 [Aromia moschata]
MLMVFLWTALIAAFFYYFFVRPLSYWKDRGVKQGRPWWIFGDNWGTLFRVHSFADMIQYVYNQCPGTRYSGIYQFLLPTLLIRDPDLLKLVTVKDFDHFVDHRPFIPEEADPLWGKNLFALKGQKWREMRAILSPSFTTSKMKAMFVLMAECAENFVQYFLEKDEDIIDVEMKNVCTRFSNDVIATTAFGIKVDSIREPNNEFYLMGKEATNFAGFFTNLKILVYFFVPKLAGALGIRLFSKQVGDFFTNLVDKTVKMREEKGIVRPDMIHLLMEARKGTLKYEENGIVDTGYATAQESDLVKNTNGKPPRNITNADIASQALIFFFAGFDAVSNLMCFLSYELAVAPEIQDRLRKEVRETSEECGGKTHL